MEFDVSQLPGSIYGTHGSLHGESLTMSR